MSIDMREAKVWEWKPGDEAIIYDPGMSTHGCIVKLKTKHDRYWFTYQNYFFRCDVLRPLPTIPTQEWKPGDAAIIDSPGYPFHGETIILGRNEGNHWWSIAGDYFWVGDLRCPPTIPTFADRLARFREQQACLQRERSPFVAEREAKAARELTEIEAGKPASGLPIGTLCRHQAWSESITFRIIGPLKLKGDEFGYDVVALPNNGEAICTPWHAFARFLTPLSVVKYDAREPEAVEMWGPDVSLGARRWAEQGRRWLTGDPLMDTWSVVAGMADKLERLADSMEARS